MKHLKEFNTIVEYNIVKDNLITPNVSLINEIYKVIYKQKKIYNICDILYSNHNGEKKVDSTVLDPSLGYTPIGICIAKTDFFGEHEPARFMSLKYMNYTTPETGSLSGQSMFLGLMGDMGDLDNIDGICKDYNDDYGYIKTSWQTQSDPWLIPYYILNKNNEWNIKELGEINKYSITDIDGKNKTNKMINLATSQPTWITDQSITNIPTQGYAPAACCCARYHTLGTNPGDWYMGASGEMSTIIIFRNELKDKINQLSAVYPNDCMGEFYFNSYLSSTVNNNYGGCVGIDNGLIGNASSTYSVYVLSMLQY